MYICICACGMQASIKITYLHAHAYGISIHILSMHTVLCNFSTFAFLCCLVEKYFSSFSYEIFMLA